MIRSKEDIYILGIESSCDETSVAVLNQRKVLSNVICTQDVHKNYGGVVPELASRAHMANIVPTVQDALKQAGISKEQLAAVAFTRGPGLMGALLVGVSFAKSLALGLNIPLIEVNHMEAHILAHLIEHPDQKNPNFPFLNLTVSGGHTQIVKVNGPLSFTVLGETLDDAAGEAFDKGAKLLGLPYPGGPEIDKLAKQGNSRAHTFPKSKVPGKNYSFSGIKTALLYFLEDGIKKNPDFINDNIADICASYQRTIIEYLLERLALAVEENQGLDIAISGGVSANSELRTALIELAEKHQIQAYVPKFEFCTDNGAMIGIAGFYKFENQVFSNQNITPVSRYPLQS